MFKEVISVKRFFFLWTIFNPLPLAPHPTTSDLRALRLFLLSKFRSSWNLTMISYRNVDLAQLFGHLSPLDLADLQWRGLRRWWECGLGDHHKCHPGGRPPATSQCPKYNQGWQNIADEGAKTPTVQTNFDSYFVLQIAASDISNQTIYNQETLMWIGWPS